MKATPKTLVHKTYGRLTVLGEPSNVGNPIPNWGVFKWHCVCSCGKETTVRGYSLEKGNTKSCGCYRRECWSKRQPIMTKLSKESNKIKKLGTQFSSLLQLDKPKETKVEPKAVTKQSPTIQEIALQAHHWHWLEIKAYELNTSVGQVIQRLVQEKMDWR